MRKPKKQEIQIEKGKYIKNIISNKVFKITHVNYEYIWISCVSCKQPFKVNLSRSIGLYDNI